MFRRICSAQSGCGTSVVFTTPGEYSSATAEGEPYDIQTGGYDEIYDDNKVKEEELNL